MTEQASRWNGKWLLHSSIAKSPPKQTFVFTVQTISAVSCCLDCLNVKHTLIMLSTGNLTKWLEIEKHTCCLYSLVRYVLLTPAVVLCSWCLLLLLCDTAAWLLRSHPIMGEWRGNVLDQGVGTWVTDVSPTDFSHRHTMDVLVKIPWAFQCSTQTTIMWQLWQSIKHRWHWNLRRVYSH